jgi:hypothetical protein
MLMKFQQPPIPLAQRARQRRGRRREQRVASRQSAGLNPVLPEIQ